MVDISTSANVKSAIRTLDIIEYVVSCDRPIVAQEIATVLAIPVSSLSYLLATLVEREYLVRDGRQYSAGPGLCRLQTYGSSFGLADSMAPLVRTLRIQLDETSSFFVRRGWEIEALVTEASGQALRYAVSPGDLVPLHAVSAGKALLAAMDESELARYFAETSRQALTAKTLTTEADLREDIERTRQTGVAYSREERNLGIIGLGTVVRRAGGVIGALSVAFPTIRFNEPLKRRASALLLKTAELVSY